MSALAEKGQHIKTNALPVELGEVVGLFFVVAKGKCGYQSNSPGPRGRDGVTIKSVI